MLQTRSRGTKFCLNAQELDLLLNIHFLVPSPHVDNSVCIVLDGIRMSTVIQELKIRSELRIHLNCSSSDSETGANRSLMLKVCEVLLELFSTSSDNTRSKPPSIQLSSGAS